MKPEALMCPDFCVNGVRTVTLNSRNSQSLTEMFPAHDWDVRRIDEMARRVRFFSSQIEKEKNAVVIRSLFDSSPLITVGPRGPQAIDQLDTTLSEHEVSLTQMNESYHTLSERARELVEARHVLRETAVFFQRVSHPQL